MDLLRDAWDEFGSPFHEGLFGRWKQEGELAIRSEPAGQDDVQWPLSAIRSALQLRLFREHRRVVAFPPAGRRAVTGGKNRQKCTVTPVSTTLRPMRGK